MCDVLFYTMLVLVYFQVEISISVSIGGLRVRVRVRVRVRGWLLISMAGHVGVGALGKLLKSQTVFLSVFLHVKYNLEKTLEKPSLYS